METLLFAQSYMFADELRKVQPSTPGTPHLYAIGFAGDGDESVFRNEVEFLQKLLAARFDATDRILELVNSPQTYTTIPLATRTNLQNALGGLTERMDRDNDILFLFLTSHGSEDPELLVKLGDLPLDQLAPADIRDALDAARIRWRVIVISACYSGGFIPALREPHTLIITAARADRASFGCGSDSQLTWFGKAFLVDALNHTTDFHAAYLEAQHTIAQWEKRDHETPSEPQFWEGPLIAAKLAAWRATLPADAPLVPFAPPPTATRNRATP
ncbi:MAG: caspase family protein [Proteobacteria bacterium]|nr:caspase family protein [Pseudomonadota bacterium]MBS0462587.1 caspase family protein [Pseudomonadota bacterium]MBS0463576.1 caspase family protein [Pseudomonadota bacterium]